MLFKLTEEDFEVLKEPLESGRQSPSSLSGALFLFIFLQSLVYYLTYYVAASTTIYPKVEQIQTIHFWFTACLVVLSVFYSFSAIAIRSQKIQYLLSILASQNIAAISFYLISLFILGDATGMTVNSLLVFTRITLLIGVLLLIVTWFRFYILLRKGHYRKGSQKGRLRGEFEKTSYIPLIVIASTGLIYVIQYVIRTFGFMDGSDMFLVVLGMILFYTMIFVLPEQLVILYCKLRFESFNFNRNGYLK